jgi:hypothetical protein
MEHDRVIVVTGFAPIPVEGPFAETPSACSRAWIPKTPKKTACRRVPREALLLGGLPADHGQ